MQVFLTFDVEVWCGSWTDLDSRFPSAFTKYVYGHTRNGDFALPRTLEILDRHQVKAIFFVEPLFAARFGLQYLETIVTMIRDAGQDVQLHLHPEWTDEISPPPIVDIAEKRQHLSYYSLEEQTTLIRLGLDLLEAAGAKRPVAFRAGSFAANANTFAALHANHVELDFSIDSVTPLSVNDLRDGRNLLSPQTISGVQCLPMAAFSDGFGKRRHVQVGACSTEEIVQAMGSASDLGWSHFVMLSHNFEMLKANSNAEDKIVVNRFEKLCRHLGSTGHSVVTTSSMQSVPVPADYSFMPSASISATLQRYAEQALRRLL